MQRTDNSMGGHAPTIGFWATMAGIAGLVYVLSFGPAMWLRQNGKLPSWTNNPLACAYYPIIWVCLTGPRPVREGLIWYAEWGTRRTPERIYDQEMMPSE